jgi:hypothetical protein
MLGALHIQPSPGAASAPGAGEPLGPDRTHMRTTAQGRIAVTSDGVAHVSREPVS